MKCDMKKTGSNQIDFGRKKTRRKTLRFEVWYTLEDQQEIHGTYSHDPFRKENDLNQTSMRTCSSR